MAFFFEQWNKNKADTKDWVTIEGKPVLIGGPSSGGGSGAGGSTSKETIKATERLLKAGFSPVSEDIAQRVGAEGAQNLDSAEILQGRLSSAVFYGIDSASNKRTFAGISSDAVETNKAYQRSVSYLKENGWKYAQFISTQEFTGIVIE